MKIEEMQQQNADVFAIPDYFLYMSRAFATLEGIGLSSDGNYSILKECFPYLAKRLLSDDSPRARGALRTLLYGGSGNGARATPSAPSSAATKGQQQRTYERQSPTQKSSMIDDS